MAKITVPVVVKSWELIKNALDRVRASIEFTDEMSPDFRQGFMSCFDMFRMVLDDMEGEQKELVNHPAHYNAPGRKECIDEMVDIWGHEQTAIWCEMTDYKYEYRAGTKEGEPDERDMAKRQWYLDKAVKLRAEACDAKAGAANLADQVCMQDFDTSANTAATNAFGRAFEKGVEPELRTGF